MGNNKDPAFLFYSSDFLTGTMFMSNEQVGMYIRLMCAQHQKGHLKEKDMRNICQRYDEDIYSKFIKDDEGLYFNKRLDLEISKRSKYSESRRNNRLSKVKGDEKDNDICGTHEDTYVSHMENENEIENINKNRDESANEKGTISAKKSARETAKKNLELNREQIANSDLPDELKAKANEWLTYKDERKEGYKPTGLNSLLTQISNKAKQNGNAYVISSITNSMANTWVGIHWDKEQTQKPQTKDWMDIDF